MLQGGTFPSPLFLGMAGSAMRRAATLRRRKRKSKNVFLNRF